MIISTKEGDKGKTKIIIGEEFYKDIPIFEAIGTIDELNSFLGVARLKTFLFRDEIKYIQTNLIKINGYIALGHESFKKDVESFFDWLENETRNNEESIEVKEFIIFGDEEASSWLDVCRTVCRRCERRIVSLIHTKDNKELENKELSILTKIFNRLSDLLFIYSILELNKTKE